MLIIGKVIGALLGVLCKKGILTVDDILEIFEPLKELEEIPENLKVFFEGAAKQEAKK